MQGAYHSSKFLRSMTGQPHPEPRVHLESSTADRNRTFYASFYENVADHTTFEILSKVLAFRRIAKYVKDAAPVRILDVGFGGGELLIECERLFPQAELFGAEFVASAVVTCRANHPAWNVVEGSATELPFEDDSVDVVISSHVLEHLTDDVAALRELARVVKPGGRIIVGVPGPASGPNPLHERLYDVAAVRNLFPTLRLLKMQTYGSPVFTQLYWMVRGTAQQFQIIDTRSVGGSKLANSVFARLSHRFGIPILIYSYLIDSVIFRSENPFETWSCWMK
jgi:ubiquinone/menaquinone biosynthesis C-methylase UbiE